MLTHRKLLLGALSGLALAAMLFVLLGRDVAEVTARTRDTSIITFVCCEYSPATVTIDMGDTVEWQGAFEDHPLRSDDSLWPAHTTGTSFSHTFPQAGFYRFFCGIHGGPGGVDMSGVVLVTWPEKTYLPFVAAG